MTAKNSNSDEIRKMDISIVKLVPRTERKVAKKYRQRIEASLRAVGLIEPLIVYPLKDGYEILDGALRYRILLDMGIETVPCLVHSSRDGLTGNRMVNPLSASQEMRMLRKSLEELDEKTIASALGMQGIEPARRTWTREAILEEVCKRIETGQSLICDTPENINLRAAAARHVGSWAKTIELAKTRYKLKKRRRKP